MSILARIQKTITLGGESFNQSSAPSGDGTIVQNIALPAGLGGVVTKITDDSGIVMMDRVNHPFEDGDKVDVWFGDYCRHNMTVSLDSNNDLELTGGFGDALPVSGTAVVVRESYFCSVSVKTDGIRVLALTTTGDGIFYFLRAVNIPLFSVKVNKNYTYDWQAGTGTAAPFPAGQTIAKVLISHSEIIGANMKLGILCNNE
jgi:hypothetical protein